MADVAEIWKASLPEVLNAVSGRGVWTALNAATPITLDEGVLILGLGHQDSELAGHLRLPSTSRLIEQAVSSKAQAQLRVRVIDGTTAADYEIVKRRDAERRRMQDAELSKMRAELNAKTNWDTVYDQLSRRYAAVPNRSLPQNRARFFEEGLELVAEARKGQTSFDDAGERSFARCLERLAQYAEVPSTIVGVEVLKRAGEL